MGRTIRFIAPLIATLVTLVTLPSVTSATSVTLPCHSPIGLARIYPSYPCTTLRYLARTTFRTPTAASVNNSQSERDIAGGVTIVLVVVLWRMRRHLRRSKES